MYPKTVLDKFATDISEYLKNSIQDSNNEVRRKSRMVFMKYYSVFPRMAHELLLNQVNLTYQKSIYDDYKNFGIDPERTMLFNPNVNELDEEAPVEIDYSYQSLDIPNNRSTNDSALSGSLVLVTQNGTSVQGKSKLTGRKSPTHNFNSKTEKPETA